MPGAKLLPSIVNACRAVVDGQDLVNIDQPALERFAANGLSAAEVQHARFVRLPITFDSQEVWATTTSACIYTITAQAEITFHMLMAALDFGRSYDALIQQQSRRDAHETIQYGVLSLQLSGHPIDAELLAKFSHYHVTSIFGLDTHQEAQVCGCHMLYPARTTLTGPPRPSGCHRQSPSACPAASLLTFTQPQGPLAAFAKLLVQVANDLGTTLQRLGKVRVRVPVLLLSNCVIE